PYAVEGSGVAGGEPFPAGQGTVAAHVEEPDVLLPGIDDIELPFVGGEGEPVRAQEPVGGKADFAGMRHDPVDVAGADLAGRLVARGVGLPAIAEIVGPNLPVRLPHDVVGECEG